MPFKRPLLSSHTTDDSESQSESSHGGPSKRRRVSSPRKDKPVLVYILQAKIHPEMMSELAMLVENYKVERGNKSLEGPSSISELNLELTGDVEKADVIVTATNMRQRLERHVEWRIAVCAYTLSIAQSACSNTIYRKRRPS